MCDVTGEASFDITTLINMNEDQTSNELIQAAKDEARRIIQSNLGADMPGTSDGVWELLESAKAAQGQIISELEAASDRAKDVSPIGLQ